MRFEARVAVGNLTLSMLHSFEMIEPNHVIMHRSVDSENVIEFAAMEKNDMPLMVKKAEDVEYKNGKLLGSVGTTTITMDGESFEPRSDDATSAENRSDEPFDNGRLRGTGTYSLKLQSCVKSSKSKLFSADEKHEKLTEGRLIAY